MRDLRDPQKLGEMLLRIKRTRRLKSPLSRVYDKYTRNELVPEYASNESCIEKYGRADEVKPLYAEIRVR